MTYEIRFTLQSDATFAGAAGVAGLVDTEVEYDAETGLPFLRGRTLKGLLVEECANILFALEQQTSPPPVLQKFQEAARFLFGEAGGTQDGIAKMHAGDALLPEALRGAVKADLKNPSQLSPVDVLESLTAIRRQTAVNEDGAPETGSLRSTRVVLRQTSFVARVDFEEEPSPDALALLAACVLAFRRAGTSRNRGRGRLAARLHDGQGQDVTEAHIKQFQRSIPPRVQP